MILLFRLSSVLVLAIACARSMPQTTAAAVPPENTRGGAVITTTDSTREYSGEWESGFEMSAFRGCNGTVPANVWLSFAPGATADTHWPGNMSGAANTRTYYMRVRGILRGPADRRRIGGGYGHLGGANYELYVTRVLDVKIPGEPNCTIQR